MTNWNELRAPSLDEIADLAEAAFNVLPEKVRRALGAVEFRVDDFASDEVLAEMEIDDPFELSGLYRGRDRLSRSVLDIAEEQSQVFLFRRPILDEWSESGEVTLQELVTHVLVHEIGHHLGLSDDQMAAIEASEV